MSANPANRQDSEAIVGGIRRIARQKCPVCGQQGPVLYQKLIDRQYGVPGQWSLRRCGDGGCATLFLDPVPVAEDLVRLYDNFYTHLPAPPSSESKLRALYNQCVAAYLSRKWAYRRPKATKLYGVLLYLDPLHRFYADRSVMFLPACPGGRLLDVGCGSGEFLMRAGNLGWTVEGVDFDPLAVELAHKRGLLVHLGTLQDQRLPSSTYDAIVMSHVIEHVPDPIALLSECHRILKPAGRLVVLTPNTASIAHRKFRESCFSLEPPRHLQLFNAAGLSRLSRAAGFASAEVASGCHGAACNFVASPIIRRAGAFNPYASWPLWTRIRALAWELAELALIKLRPFDGEELRMIATKEA